MYKGILLVLIACFIWGLIFVIPPMMTGFTPIEIALSRYFFFGLLSLFLIAIQWKSFLQIPKNLWAKALILSFFVNIAYYLCLVLGILYSSASVATLIFGICPITIALYGNYRSKEMSFRSLILPCIAIGTGLVLVNLQELEFGVNDSFEVEYLFGILCSISAVALWTWYAITNAKILKTHQELNASSWASLMGGMTFVWVLLIIAALKLFHPDPHFFRKYSSWSAELGVFLMGGAALGFLCSWFGSYLWNRASHFLPVSLAGQLTVFETIFGLVFVYTIQNELPERIEFLGISIMLGGIIVGLSAFKKASSPEPI